MRAGTPNMAVNPEEQNTQPAGGQKDIATLAGVVLAIVGLLAGFMIDGGNPMALMNIPAFCVVGLGTMGVTLGSVRLKTFLLLPKLAIKAINPPPMQSYEDLIDLMVKLAETARSQGLLQTEGDVNKLDNQFLQKGMRMVIDGDDAEAVREMLEIDTLALKARHRSGYEMFKKAAGFAPTLGILGTVMGLISVLGKLSDPTSLGPSISTAFIATLYGVGSANVVFFPLANKLAVMSEEEVAQREFITEGILLIQQGTNPRQVRERLESFLPPKPAEERKPPSDASVNNPFASTEDD